MLDVKVRKEPDHTTRIAFFILAVLLLSAAAIKSLTESRPSTPPRKM